MKATTYEIIILYFFFYDAKMYYLHNFFLKYPEIFEKIERMVSV